MTPLPDRGAPRWLLLNAVLVVYCLLALAVVSAAVIGGSH